jgi:type IV pilus biogenesis protein CpaD/CtpE
MLHRLSVLSAAALLAGCASTDAPMKETAPQFTEAEKAEMSTEEKAEVYNASVAQEEDRVVCRRVTPTGSHRSKTVCRTVSEAAVEREAAQETLRKGRGTSFKPGN